jgi:hypothetical protein
MSTNDVPGANAKNGDILAAGCWAEHEDESLIFVEGNEQGRVIFCVFDVEKTPIIQYRHAMPETAFKKQFSWNAKDKDSIQWTWHDKTPFPWDRIIKEGLEDGPGYASAEDQLTAAERVAESLRMRGRELDENDFAHRRDEPRERSRTIMDRIRGAVNELRR